MKSKWKTIILFLTTSLLINCSENKLIENPLDCVLRNYVNYFKPTKNEAIVISESQYWTPNSSYIIIRKVNRSEVEIDDGHKRQYCTFNGTSIFYYTSALYNKKIDLKSKIPTSLNFKNYIAKKMEQKENDFPQKKEFPDLKFEYNFKLNKITKVFDIAPKYEELKDMIIENCGVIKP